ncbi:TPA: hypothetical protein ACG5G3_001026 [Streptococcus agalactiae]
MNSDVEEEVTRNVLFASFSCVTGTAASHSNPTACSADSVGLE